LVRFIADTVLDGGAGVVMLNHELLTKLEHAGYAEAINEIRDVAAKALRGEPDEALNEFSAQPDYRSALADPRADDADDDSAED
jgi:hypothetical protein